MRTQRNSLLSGGLLPIVALLAASACGSSPTTPTSTTTSPATETWSVTLVTPGFVSRSFTASQAGSVSVTISSAAESTVPVSLGIGIPESGGSGCTVSQAVPAVASTDVALTTSVDQGTFCLKLYNEEPSRESLAYSITLVRP